MTDDDLHRSRRTQSPWQWALGMLSRGARPAQHSLVTVVDDVSRVNAPMRGLFYGDRHTSPAFVGTHSCIQLTAGPAGLKLWQLTTSIQAVQLSSHAGAGVANVVVLDPEVVGNLVGWGATTPASEFPSPQFGGWGPSVARPYTVTRMSCGQLGPIVVGQPWTMDAASLDGALRRFAVREFNPPLTLNPNESFFFIGQLANVLLDVSFLVEVPLLAPQVLEGF